MEDEMFSSTRDWGNEIWVSLWWVAQAWFYAVIATLIVVTLLCLFTQWGRQAWKITGEYFHGPGSPTVWVWFAGLVLLVVIGVRLDVLLSYAGSDAFTSFQVIGTGIGADNAAIKESGRQGFWLYIRTFSVLAAIYVARVMLDLYLFQRFVLRWRAWLTERLTGDWLDRRAYYRGRFIDDTIDNPDQRIQYDIDIFTTGYGPLPNQPNLLTNNVLLFGAIEAIVSLISFAGILWELSGPLALPLVGELPRALFWIGLAYVVVATIFAFIIGKPLMQLSFNNEKYNAAFRYALVRLRDAAEAVAFYRGEAAERLGLRRLFSPVVANYKRFVGKSVQFYGWNMSISQIIVPLPYILQFPRFFAGQIKLGDMSQSTQAFSNIQTGLSFFRNSYDQFAGYRAAVLRLYGLINANEQSRELPTITTADCADGAVELAGVEVWKPDGEALINPIDLRLEIGDAMIVTGASGSGKTTLLRSLAELWPYTRGTLTRPCGPNETMFLSQMPYVPLGDLRTVVSYPLEVGTLPDADLQAALDKVALPHLTERLDEVLDWAKVLSPGEQQRVAFARILLTKPKAAFLDESTSALDEGVELLLYRLVRTELPETILVSVSHRSTVEQHHNKHFQLIGDGEWRFGTSGEKPVTV